VTGGVGKGKMKCIYCGPGKESSKEDVIPYAIGGRYNNSEIICRDCNSYFGTNVDHYITNWSLSLIARNWFDLEGHGGGMPRYEVETEDGQILTVEGKGVLRPKWREIVSRQDGNSFYFSGGAPTEKDARKAIASVIAKQVKCAGRPPAIRENRVDVHVRREWKPFESDVVYDYRKQGRAIAKMAFHYLATQLDRRFLRTRDFIPVKRFVRDGEHGKHPRLCQPAIPQEFDDTASPRIEHSLTLRCSRELRSAVSDVALFGVLRFSVVLSYSYEGPDLFRRLTMYPLEERWEEGEAPDLSPVPARLVLNIDNNERKARYDHLEEAVHSLVDWLNLYGFCHHIRETLPKVIEHVNSQIALANHDVDAWLAAVADEFSDRSSPAALFRFVGEPSRTAAEIISTEFQRQRVDHSPTSDAVEDMFSRLIFIRLLVDALALVIHRKSQAVSAVDTACVHTGHGDPSVREGNISG